MTLDRHSRRVIGPRRCWDFADQKIRELRAKIKLAEDGDYKGNPAVMRDMLDKWLEYRHAHGPKDERQPL